MVFGVRSIRVFSKFLLDPYYEPLLWFMINYVIFVKFILLYASNTVVELLIIRVFAFNLCFD